MSLHIMEMVTEMVLSVIRYF